MARGGTAFARVGKNSCTDTQMSDFAVLVVLALALVTPCSNDPAVKPSCITSWAEVRYGNLGYDHVVHLRSRCDAFARCEVSSDRNPAKQLVSVAPGAEVEVLVFRGSPARTFVPRVLCRVRPTARRESGGLGAGLTAPPLPRPSCRSVTRGAGRRWRSSAPSPRSLPGSRHGLRAVIVRIALGNSLRRSESVDAAYVSLPRSVVSAGRPEASVPARFWR
jgi:hypothetical protein